MARVRPSWPRPVRRWPPPSRRGQLFSPRASVTRWRWKHSPGAGDGASTRKASPSCRSAEPPTSDGSCRWSVRPVWTSGSPGCATPPRRACSGGGCERAGLGDDLTRAGMERIGFYVCDADLEDELIRALGVDAVVQLIEAAGDLSSWRTLQKQPAQQGRSIEAQLRRFMGTRGGRKVQYARLLVDALDLDSCPAAAGRRAGARLTHQAVLRRPDPAGRERGASEPRPSVPTS